MFSAFQTFGRLGAGGLPFSERALWPLGASSPGLWIDGPSYPASCFQDSAGTTPLSTAGTVLDSSNPVGLILDRKGGLALGPELFSSSLTPTIYNVGGTNGVYTAETGTFANTAPGAAYTPRFAFSILGSFKSYRVSGTIVSGANRIYSITTTTASANPGGGAEASLTQNGYFEVTLYSLTNTFCIWTKGDSVWSDLVITNLSIREIPGIHLSQSTSAARPVASARVNLLTYSEDFSNAVWVKQSVTVASNVMTKSATPLSEGCLQINIPATATGVKSSVFAVASAGSAGAYLYLRNLEISDALPTGLVQFDLSSGSVVYQGSAYSAATISPIAGGKWLCTVTGTDSGVTAASRFDIGISDTIGSIGCAIGKYINIFSGQFQLGNPSTYQRVGAASDYTTTGFPLYAKFDGTDDALASAAFAAGTLTSSMDCLIAVRRDSAANAVCGLYNAVADATKYFGMAESGSSSGCVGSGAGTPTVLVDGVQLTGGTAVTRGTLHTALTAGAWHIVEFRGLDLSTWTAVGHGLYTSYVRNGAFGKIKLFASGQDANRDKERQRMAAYFGVTLP